MIIRLLRVLCAAGLLLRGAVLLGQTTGVLTGRVTAHEDANAGLGGVTVLATSPALQGNRVVVTQPDGEYRFDALPPGAYMLKFERDDRVTGEVHVRVGLSQVARADFSMWSGVSAMLEVRAPEPVVGTQEVSTNLTLKQIDRLPIQRNQLATAQFAPGVTANSVSNGQLQISGGPGYDNLVLVNGVVVNENTRGQMRPLYVEDAIQETTILTGAISAEYGRFSGGVVSTITKAGGNELGGSLRDSLSSPAWSAQTPAFEAREHTLNHVWEATLGGAALRDRLWFFTAGRWAKNDTARQTVALPGASSINYTEGNDQKRYELKLTGHIADDHTITASYFGIQTNGTNVRFNNNIYDLASLTERDDPESLVSAHYDGILSPGVLLEGLYAARKFADRTGASATDIINGTVLLDRSNSNTRFNAPTLCGVCDVERRNNSDVILKGHGFFERYGTHAVVGGIDRFAERRYANNHQSGSDFSLFVTRVQSQNGQLYPIVTPTTATGGGTFIRWNPILVAARENELRTDSAFANDVWSLTNRLSLSLGARWDRNHAEDADGVVSSDDARVSPRLGVQFDVSGGGKQFVNASYAEYASRIADSIASSNQASGNAAAIDFVYRGPAINDKTLNTPLADVIRMVFDYFNTTQGGTANRAATNLRASGSRSIPGYSTYFDGTLVSPSVRELTVGYGAQLTPAAYVRADYIHRDWHDFYAASVTTATRHVTTPLGIPVDLALMRNSNNVERTYRAIQLQGRWSNQHLETGVHYTWSKLRGNDEGESGTTGAVANVDPSLYYPEYFNYPGAAPVGYLPGDQRHRARAWATFTYGAWSASTLHSYDSGLPYSIAGPIVLTRYVTNPGYASVPNALYYFSGRGALRTDNIQSTDIALRYTHPIAAVELFAQGDVLNVFNRQGIADPQRIGLTVTTAATSPALQPFNPATETPQRGVNYQLAPNFGQPLNDQAYQRPRTVRFSLGVRF